jgi:glycosyltransferase involved in cell wall biosynthesis
MVELACGMASRGHAVEFVVYFPKLDFFRPRLDELGIKIHCFPKGSRLSLRTLFGLARLLRVERYDVAVSYLRTPSVYLELAGIVSPTTRVVVSERSSYLRESPGFGQWAERALHSLAHRVVANSRSHAEWLRARFPWLSTKVVCIYNGVAIPDATYPTNFPQVPHQLRLLVVGRVGPEKNALNLMRACISFEQRYGWAPQVTWVGKRDVSPSGIEYCAKIDEFLAKNPSVEQNWHWLGERADIVELLSDHHALIHASFFEGLPNVVCEALTVGKPVLLSNVCDHPYLVTQGERGFLFDPHEPDSIVDAINSLAALDEAAWRRMTSACLEYAQRELAIGTMLDRYECLFADMDSGRLVAR